MSHRLLDITLVVLSLPLTLPLAVVTAWQVRRRLGSPVLFRQTRPGLKGALFEMLKFRTMTDARDADGKLLPDAERLTDFGRWLRSTSLDELPGLLNVLRGEMSLVGPRPERPELAARLSLDEPAFRLREAVKPGLTGLAQVEGLYQTSPTVKLLWDLRYMAGWRLFRDIVVLAGTVVRILFRVWGPSAGAPSSITPTSGSWPRAMRPSTGSAAGRPWPPSRPGS